MALPLLALGLAAVSGIGSGMAVAGSGVKDPDMKPKIWGMPAVPVMAGGGLLLTLLGGSLLGPVGIGLMAGSLASGHTLKTVKAGIDEIVQNSVQAQLAQQGGGTARIPQPPAPPALPDNQAGGGSLLNQLTTLIPGVSP